MAGGGEPTLNQIGCEARQPLPVWCRDDQLTAVVTHGRPSTSRWVITDVARSESRASTLHPVTTSPSLAVPPQRPYRYAPLSPATRNSAPSDRTRPSVDEYQPMSTRSECNRSS